MLQITPADRPNTNDLDTVFSDDDTKPGKKKKATVRSLGDIYNEIKSVCKSLEKVNLKFHFEEIDFIPSEEITSELREFMTKFERSQNLSLFSTLDCSKYSKNIQLQISLLRSYIDPSITFTEVPDEIDPRISSLLHWKISSHLSKGEKCYHLLHSLMDYVKTPEPAPISVFFIEFNISSLIYQFCQTLVSLFNDSPLLSSYLDNLSAFSNNPDSIRSLSKETEKSPGKLNSDSGLKIDDDDDDDDFDDLKAIPKNTAKPIISIESISFDNPLDNLSDSVDSAKIPEGPSPVTFRFFKNKPKSSPDEFSKWLLKHHCLPKKIFNYSSDQAASDESPSSFKSKFKSKLKLRNRNEFSDQKASEELIDSLLGTVFDSDVRSSIPPNLNKKYFSVMLSIIHQINCTTRHIFLADNVAKDIIEKEYQAHVGCCSKDQKKIESSINFFAKDIPSNLNQIQISPLGERRPFPSTETEITKDFLLLMKLVDYSLITSGYSPISLIPSSLPPQTSNFSKGYLAQSIYYLYTQNAYPPYICFRTSFAIGILISDKDPSLACDFMYEAIFLLLHFYPQLNYATFIQSAFFEMGVLFNATNRYYFCCMSMDNAINLCQNNHSLAVKAASTAAKNYDAVRAVFHYLSAIKLFIASHQKEEFLYTSQLVVAIYVEHNLINEAIQLTSYILKVHDKLDSINSVNAAAALCRLYCTKRNFDDALKLANSIDTSNSSFAVIASKIKSHIYDSQNKFDDFYEIIKKNLNLQNNSLPAAYQTKEVLLPAIKSLSKAYVSKEDFVTALFWSEIGCHISSHISANKELANFYSLRGIILYFIYYKMFDKCIVLSNLSLDQTALNFGQFENDIRITKTEILKEGLSSLQLSSDIFERSGNVAKLLYSKSLYLQMICSHLLLYRKVKGMKELFSSSYPISKEDLPLIIKAPSLYSKCKVASAKPKSRYIDELEIKSGERFTNNVKALQNIANSYYDPFYVSMLESISSVLFFLKNDMKSSKLMFDLGLENIRKYFFKGTRFIVSNCKIWMTYKFVYFIRFLYSFLMEFPADFIRDRLFLFDMMNDVSLLLNYQKNGTITQRDNKNTLSIEFTASICQELDDSNWPKFSELLESDENTNISISSKMFTLYEQIFKNETSYSDDQISTTNKKLLMKINELKKKQVISDFSIPDHSVYVFLGNSEICSFIPSNETKRSIPIEILHQPSFVEGVINMIDWHLKIQPFSNDFMKYCLFIGKNLFGNFDFFKQFSIQEKENENENKNVSNRIKKTIDFSPPSAALVVISDHLLEFLPFEFFFPTISLIRRLTSKERENHTFPLRPIVFRNENKLDFIQYRRKKISEFLMHDLPVPVKVSGNEGNLPIQFPLFNPNKITPRYLLLFSFFDIIPIQQNNLPDLSGVKYPLFILTFSDLVLMPDFIFQLIDQNAKSCFIFVPSSYVSVALFEMKKVIDEIMLENNAKKSNDQSNYQNIQLFTEKFTFMSTLQMALMKKLRIPIAIISPNLSII